MSDSKIGALTETTTPASTAAIPVVTGGSVVSGVIVGGTTQRAQLGNLGLVAKGSLVFNVKDYGAVGDGITNDYSAIQNAINAASTAGGGVVFFPIGTYKIGTALLPKSNITFRGVGQASVITTSTTMTALFLHTQGVGVTCTDVRFESLSFLGSVTSTSSTPSRSRTRGTGAQSAIWMSGSLDTSTAPTTNPFGTTLPDISAGPYGVVQNIRIINCNFRNFIWLPTRLFGVTGYVIECGNEFYNSMDVGFGFNESVICNYNRVQMSADNGISLSRGNTNVVCIGNNIDNCQYTGIFCSGYSGTLGPSHFVLVGNNITNVRDGGIAVMIGASYGTVSGNHIDRGYYKDTTNTGTIGIALQGNDGTFTAGTVSRGISVTGNTIKGSCMAGIYLLEVQDVIVQGNTILDAGTQFLADGTTAIATNDSTQNIGILVDTLNATPCTNVIVRDNMVSDTRGTTYMTYGIYPQTAPANVVYGPNTIVGAAQAMNLNTTVVQTPAGTYPSETLSGPDSDIGKVTTVKGNGLVATQFTNSGGITSILRIHNTALATGSGAGQLVSLGNTPQSPTKIGGGWGVFMVDSSSNSIKYERVLSNGTLTASDNSAADYLTGTATGPERHIQSMLYTTKGRVVARVAKTANYTILRTDHIIAYTALAAPRTVTLPTAVGFAGQVYVIKDESGAAATNNLTIATTSSQTIDGASTSVISTNYGFRRIYSDGANWFTIGSA